MNLTDLITFLTAFFPYGFIKIAVLIIVGIYIIFALIIVKQESLMSRVVIIPFSPLLRLVTNIHLIASVVVFFLALLLL